MSAYGLKGPEGPQVVWRGRDIPGLPFVRRVRVYTHHPNNGQAPDESGSLPSGAFRVCGGWGQGCLDHMLFAVFREDDLAVFLLAHNSSKYQS